VSVCLTSLCLSLLPIDRPQQWLAVGLLLGAPWAGYIDRQRQAATAPQHGAAAVNAGSVTLTAAAAG